MTPQTETAAFTGGDSGIHLPTGGPIKAGRLFLLEMSGDRIHAMNPDGSDRRTIVTGCHLPDGIVVDAAAGHIYWTNGGAQFQRRFDRARRSRWRRSQGDRPTRRDPHAETDPPRQGQWQALLVRPLLEREEALKVVVVESADPDFFFAHYDTSRAGQSAG